MYASPGQGGTVGLAMGVMPVAFDDTTGDLMDRKLLQPSRAHIQARSGWRTIKPVRNLQGGILLSWLLPSFVISSTVFSLTWQLLFGFYEDLEQRLVGESGTSSTRGGGSNHALW
ncbi:hypothetical protein LY76DRAFT_600766 [Colletotrichum caudatum]|nr:hypothetical protein LY76DRAFT_600766 [Colletotrichum caudatum]